MIIYKATCLISGKSYVGQTIAKLSRRRRQHERAHDSGLFVKALKLYGKDAFVWEILDTCGSREELDFLEHYYIRSESSLTPGGYNSDTGGTHHVASPETRKKISQAHLGKRYSPKTEIKKGQRLSPSTEFKKGQKVAHARKVIDLHSGIVYESVTEAAHSNFLKVETMFWRIKRGKRCSRFQFVEAA